MKKLIEALHVIQDECKKHEGDSCCEECPLGANKYSCLVISRLPSTWKINDEARKALL